MSKILVAAYAGGVQFLDAYNTSLGVPVIGHTYLSDPTWAARAASVPGKMAGYIKHSPGGIIVSMSLSYPLDAASVNKGNLPGLKELVAGKWDSQLKAIFTGVAAVYPAAHLRFDYECNGAWMNGYAKGNEQVSNDAFVHAAHLAYSISPHFQIERNMSMTTESYDAFGLLVEPVAEVCTHFGLDVYDRTAYRSGGTIHPNGFATDPAQRWAQIVAAKTGMDRWVTACTRHDKKFSLSEFGVSADAHVPGVAGDNPLFITSVVHHLRDRVPAGGIVAYFEAKTDFDMRMMNADTKLPHSRDTWRTVARELVAA